jgi:hypothetical protein
MRLYGEAGREIVGEVKIKGRLYAIETGKFLILERLETK